MQLRPYQEEARKKVQEQWEGGVNKTLLVLPTGCGKTIVFSKIIEDRVKLGERVLILAHRSELLEQASDKLKKSTGLNTALEKADSSSLNSWYMVTVGSVQTLQREKRLKQFSNNYFDTIVIDEAHHCISNGYQNVLNHFDKAKVLGVTATPDRGDMKDLGTYFESLAYEYKIVDAIKEGYLSKIQSLTIPLNQNGDFKASDVSNALDPYLEQIADEMIKHCSDRKTVVFLPLVATSQKFRDILNSKGFKAAEVNGESKDRAQILEDFDKDKYNVLCNSMLLTEGWDCPSVDCVIVLRPTKVRALYSQMVGRGTRLHPGKENLLLLDFLWHVERHELCRPAHLIAKSEEVVKKMTELSEKEVGNPLDLEEIEVKATEEVIQDREASLAKQLAEQRRKKSKLVDPLQFEMSIADEDLANYIPSFISEQAPPSKKQIETLEKMGINANEIDNSGKAKLLIKRIIKRREAGLATPKQIRLLESRGFRKVGSWKFEEANNMITRIAANGWRLPRGVIAKDFKPGA